MEAVTHFLFLGSKITVNSDCSHEIRRRLLLVRKAMTNQFSGDELGQTPDMVRNRMVRDIF